MEGLNANLINISQVCDYKCIVKLIKKDCTMYDDLGNTLIRGIRLKDSCFFIGTHLKVCVTG